MNGAIAPIAMRVNISESDIANLNEKLARMRWPDQLEGTTWEYGCDLKYLKVRGCCSL